MLFRALPGYHTFLPVRQFKEFLRQKSPFRSQGLLRRILCDLFSLGLKLNAGQRSAEENNRATFKAFK
jgi:hypothetical protein